MDKATRARRRKMPGLPPMDLIVCRKREAHCNALGLYGPHTHQYVTNTEPHSLGMAGCIWCGLSKYVWLES